MKLYIAEKPSLGRAIAAALPKPHKNLKTHIEVGNGDIVTWCIGHILEQADPEVYQAHYKKWNAEHLPIVPEKWVLKPKSQTRSQLTAIKALVKNASQIIHAGDPDREGQLLVDEVIDYLKVSKTKKQQVQRLLISDLNTPAVKRSLNNLQSNMSFMPLSISALARSRADWLYGINLTRAYTLQGQKSGYNSVLSVGRVQTPILGLVVNRDNEIDNFTPHNYFEVVAHIQYQDENQSNQIFKAKWKPSAACLPHCDDNQRVMNQALANNVAERITNQDALVTELTKQNKKQNAPLPYNLSSLQIDAAKQFSLSAKMVLDLCQSLYERHKLITYPRSDSRYLPTDQLSQVPSIMKHLTSGDEKIAQMARNADMSLKSKAWNNSKVTAHHAIIPTEKSAANINLNQMEKNIYFLICRQYIAQFYSAYQYLHCHLELTISGGIFVVNANEVQQLGWKTLFQSKGKFADSSSKTDEQEQHIPALAVNDVLHCEKGEVLQKETQPPKSFTDATLLAAMTGISRYVTDVEIKKVLKETDGLGTEATRAGIIDLLFNRGFLVREGKAIKSTTVGKTLIKALPDKATTPDMTAQWEATLNDICEQKVNYQSFMQPLLSVLNTMVGQAKQQDFSGLPNVAFKRKTKGKSNRSWGNSKGNSKVSSKAKSNRKATAS
ncbi:DNA topoisomerase 3 [Psychrosphaera saromensis]|uniref:DNA topoisomerase n=1 Tax=Psychrosphaera saromensis TaxID=716813 RepID=A0A2S7UYX7_9GAMM|nr:DNA topoisomerase III [Psychrosphaera saromensis]PQJ54470.1 DNA topoisomerase III [Psychrosphaera saromensis]GHB59709.1 DNA topoisomerase 3 [Psychrosphaera saromensis]GLQ14334.1 DNA topoisomerase 3 [Psychrosphaera saromensis]